MKGTSLVKKKKKSNIWSHFEYVEGMPARLEAGLSNTPKEHQFCEPSAGSEKRKQFSVWFLAHTLADFWGNCSYITSKLKGRSMGFGLFNMISLVTFPGKGKD